MTLAGWASSSYYGAGATVSGISVGAGSGAGADYHAFADNVTYTTTQGSTTYNFETLVSAAPEPATWGMMIVGFGIVGGATRRQKRGERALLA
ncbi:PEP-CTERM sorting domain-containing protein [Sphingomonas paeninsulae]|uniref:PEP-CTERM sorting domain-containing protein n=1 Tax=Sphingomonas paeninsulae TaxID=2319844 RepID=A0A494T9R1_SPHPE|nr:PEPxxWA-CTERM sorting domain-containing protein [Sphingomonas paeninsulae]AYJ86129.1 PEP-CTERM sorting domain-containing protein [Sphingomonas paeninsulae]